MSRLKKRITATSACLALVALLIACNSAKEESAAVVIDKEQIKKEIQAKENQFAELYNAGEMRTIGYFADDAVSFSQNKAPLVGKEAILAYLKEGIDSTSAGNKISFVTNDVFVSTDGIQVVETGYYKLVDATDAVINSGNYMVLFEKRNGNYVCVRDMSASDRPLD